MAVIVPWPLVATLSQAPTPLTREIARFAVSLHRIVSTAAGTIAKRDRMTMSLVR
jgi:hypothetical protein